jgi:hypothetical protein
VYFSSSYFCPLTQTTNNCCQGDDSIYTNGWGRTRCSHKVLRYRTLIFNNDSPCASPFSQPTELQHIGYFPVSGNKIDNKNNKIEDNNAIIDIVCDRTQDLNTIVTTDNKLILIDINVKQIICTGKIRSYDKLSATDASIFISLVRNQYKYSELFLSNIP